MNHQKLIEALEAEFLTCLVDPDEAATIDNAKPGSEYRFRRLERVLQTARRLQAERAPLTSAWVMDMAGGFKLVTFEPPVPWREQAAVLDRVTQAHKAARQPVWDAVTSTEREGAVAGWLDQDQLYS